MTATRGPAGMPFLCAASQGGPYDDEALVAGFRLGALHATLGIGAATAHDVKPLVVLLPPELERQADLLAMHHGYTMTRTTDVEPPAGPSVHFTFTRGTPL